MYDFNKVVDKIDGVGVEKYTFDEFFGSYKKHYEVDSHISAYSKWKNVEGREYVGLSVRGDEAYHIYNYCNETFYIIHDYDFVYCFEINDIIKLILK